MIFRETNKIQLETKFIEFWLVEFLEHPWYRFNLLSISVHQNVERLGLKYARKLEVNCDASAVRASLECSLIDLASVSYYI